MRSLALAVLVFGVSAAMTAMAFRSNYAGTPTFLALTLGTSAVLAAAGLFKAYRDGELRDWLKPRWGDFSGGALAAAVLFGVTYVIFTYVAAEGTPRHIWMMRLYLQLGSPVVLREKAALVGVAIVLFAATDAIAWRGLVTSLFAERFGSRMAWIWSGALYGLSYLPAAYVLREGGLGVNVVLVLAALAVGLVLGAATRVFGRLVPGIIGHALFAWFALMTYRFMTPSV